MPKRCKNKLWLFSLKELFCSTSLIPLEGMSTSDQLNSLSRLIIIIGVVLIILNVPNALIFILISLLFIIIIYFIQIKQMDRYVEPFNNSQSCSSTIKEQFNNGDRKNSINYPNWNQQYNSKDIKNNQVNEVNLPTSNISYNSITPPKMPYLNVLDLNTRSQGISLATQSSKVGTVAVENPTTYRFCDDDSEINVNASNYESINQKLAGRSNPKTLIQPVVINPIADFEHWSKGNLSVPRGINSESNQDVYLSGYKVSTDCGIKNKKPCKNPFKTLNTYNRREDYSRSDNIVENYGQSGENVMTVDKCGNNGLIPGTINDSCCYNANNPQLYGLAVNDVVSSCGKNEKLKNYNDNIYKQVLQPGLYSKTNVNPAIGANIGISYQQQFLPTTFENETFNQQDPNSFDPIEPNYNDISEVTNGINVSNVYDPRQTGYGTSYRSYTENVTGQTRFMYDDINSIKMPTLITRSNIDFERYANSYGPMKPDGEDNTASIRELVNNSFVDNAIFQRTSMQESLMRKVNSEMGQRRMAPKNTSSQKNMGGIRCF